MDSKPVNEDPALEADDAILPDGLEEVVPVVGQLIW